MVDHNTQIQRKAFDHFKAQIGYARYRKSLDIINSLPKKGLAVEVGCCGGEFLDVLRQSGWDVQGFEISEKTAQVGRKRGIDVVVHDANDALPLDDNSVDVLIAGELIEHLYDDIGFLNECHRVLKRGGTLIITTPNILSLKNRFIMLFGGDPRYALSHVHYKVYTPNWIRRAFRLSAFKQVELRGNYVIFSKNRMRSLGSLFEWLATYLPNLSEHFIAVARKR